LTKIVLELRHGGIGVKSYFDFVSEYDFWLFNDFLWIKKATERMIIFAFF